jgi:hypothetical protein
MRYITQPGGTYGGFVGNQGAVAGGNPLLDPRFKIQGGEPWHKPLLPGKETKEYEEKQFTFPLQPQLPAAGVGNVGGMLVAQSRPASGSKPTLKQLIGNRDGGMSDIPGDVRTRQDTQFLPYDPTNYTMNNRSNPLRNYRWPYGVPEGLMPGIRPYFERYQGPGLQGELGTGAI